MISMRTKRIQDGVNIIVQLPAQCSPPRLTWTRVFTVSIGQSIKSHPSPATLPDIPAITAVRHRFRQNLPPSSSLADAAPPRSRRWASLPLHSPMRCWGEVRDGGEGGRDDDGGASVGDRRGPVLPTAGMESTECTCKPAAEISLHWRASVVYMNRGRRPFIICNRRVACSSHITRSRERRGQAGLLGSYHQHQANSRQDGRKPPAFSGNGRQAASTVSLLNSPGAFLEFRRSVPSLGDPATFRWLWQGKLRNLRLG